MKITGFRFLIIVFYFISHPAFSQYKTSFKIEDKNIKVVMFEAKQVSLITLKTTKYPTFIFESSSEGPYSQDLYFDYDIKHDSLLIKSVYPKHLEFGDNKMTSMQEFSVSASLSIPHNLNLIIDSGMASIVGSGVFDNVQINTESGQCRLNKFSGNASINTYDGKIYIKTSQSKVKARSQTGHVSVDTALVKHYQLNLRTVNGDIDVIQTK